MNYATSREKGIPKSGDIVVGVRFVNDNGLFGSKTYEYFADTETNPKKHSWASVRVGNELKSVFIVLLRSVRDGDNLKRMVCTTRAANIHERLNKKYAKAIEAYKLEVGTDLHIDWESFNRKIRFGNFNKAHVDTIGIAGKVASFYAIDEANSPDETAYSLQWVQDQAQQTYNAFNLNMIKEEKQTMSNIITNIQQITFINGGQAAAISDERLLEMISDTQAEIARLETLNATTQSKKISAKIGELQGYVTQAVAILDGRS